MGLSKGIENIYGAKFDYHKISDIHIIANNNGVQLRMIVDSYLDKNARIAGKESVRTENIIQNADFTMNAFYTLLKMSFGDYADAKDEFDDSWKTVETSPKIFTQQTPNGKFISQRTETENENETYTTTENRAGEGSDQCIESPESDTTQESEITPETNDNNNLQNIETTAGNVQGTVEEINNSELLTLDQAAKLTNKSIISEE